MLAYQNGLSSKCVSERHVYASRNKLTAGDAAKRMTKALGTKVLAKDVKELYVTHFGREAEWHHSGFYQGGSGRTMGRTFFLSEEEVQALIDNYAALVQKRADNILRQEAEKKRQRETVVTGFYYTWDYDYGGNHGKRRTFKVLQAYEGDELHCPKNFTACNAATLKRVKTVVGRKYYGWDEPKLEEFSKKAFDEEALLKAEREAQLEAQRKRWEEEARQREVAKEAYRLQMVQKMEENIDKLMAVDVVSMVPAAERTDVGKYLHYSLTNRSFKGFVHDVANASGLDYQVCLAFVNSDHFKQQFNQ